MKTARLGYVDVHEAVMKAQEAHEEYLRASGWIYAPIGPTYFFWTKDVDGKLLVMDYANAAMLQNDMDELGL